MVNGLLIKGQNVSWGGLTPVIPFTCFPNLIFTSAQGAAKSLKIQKMFVSPQKGGRNVVITVMDRNYENTENNRAL